jgi:hypothetical protein
MPGRSTAGASCFVESSMSFGRLRAAIKGHSFGQSKHHPSGCYASCRGHNEQFAAHQNELESSVISLQSSDASSSPSALSEFPRWGMEFDSYERLFCPGSSAQIASTVHVIIIFPRSRDTSPTLQKQPTARRPVSQIELAEVDVAYQRSNVKMI